ncbi:MAG: hypothetical protein NUW37_08800 [Planctomycetes bacterium]|nr:hypothetical protein [Planctomycetota bacterium]
MAKQSAKQIPHETLVVGSKVKGYIKAKHDGHMVSGDFVEALSRQVEQVIDAAVARCDANKRSTLRGTDL